MKSGKLTHESEKTTSSIAVKPGEEQPFFTSTLNRKPLDAAIQRQPLPGKIPEMPPVTGCSFIWKDGRPYLKCENLPVPGPLSNTPDLPLTPEGWRELWRKLRPKSGPEKASPVFPPFPWEGGAFDLSESCKLAPEMFPDLCLKRPFGLPQPEPGGPTPFSPVLPPLPQLGNLKSTVLDRFAQNSAALPSGSEEILKALAAQINALPPGQLVHIDGHASSEGSAERNRQLSIERANTVGKRLEALGVANPSNLMVEGKSSTEPAVDNETTEEAKGRNRRVEVWFFTDSGAFRLK